MFVTGVCPVVSKGRNNNLKFEVMEVLIAFLTFFGMVFGIYYMYFTTRNRERLALIEKGADASLFNTGKEPSQAGNTFSRIFSVLKIGLFLIGTGLGVLAGYLVSMAGMEEGAAYPSMILLFGGIGLVVYHLLSRRNKE